MKSNHDEQSMLGNLRKAFPHGKFPDQPQCSSIITHANRAAIRRDLVMFLSRRQLEWLPLVLYDAVLHGNSFREDDGDYIVRYLDIIGESTATREAEAQRTIVTMEEHGITGKAGEFLQELFTRKLPWPDLLDKLTDEQKDAYMRDQFEKGFVNFSKEQSCAVYHWLLYASEKWKDSVCTRELERAISYWRDRCTVDGTSKLTASD